MKIKSIFLVLISLSLTPYFSISCSCDTVKFEDAIEYSDEIFIGQIIESRRIKMNTHDIDHPDNYEEIIWNYKFKVDKKWKGSKDEILEIYQRGNSCDIYFDIYDQDFLVYSSKYYHPKDLYPLDKFTKF